MRKWMSERLKRRKKAQGKTTAQQASPAPAPLQPRFYDDDVATPAPAAIEEIEAVLPPSPEPEPPPQAEPVEEAVPAQPSTEVAPGPRMRRRRTRGRRGRFPQQPPAAATTATAEGPAEEASSSATEAADTAEATVPEPAPAVPPPEAAAAPPQPAPAAPIQATPVPARASKGTVVLAIGLPGSGKSSWFKRHSIHPLSSDLLRELLFDNAEEQRFQDLVFSNLRSMLKARLIARRPMNYVDATNLTPHDRHSWIKLAKDYGYDVQGLFFDVPLEVCLERHARRGRVVPEDVMRRMASKLKPPTFDEGFSKITVVRVKKKPEPAQEAGQSAG